jgi:hypothetical protein
MIHRKRNIPIALILAFFGLIIVGLIYFMSHGLFGNPGMESLQSYPHPKGEYEARIYQYAGNASSLASIHVDVALINQRKKANESSIMVYTAYYRNENYELRWLSSDSLEIRHDSDFDPLFVEDSIILSDSRKIFICIEKD